MATLGLGEVSAIQLAAICNLTTRCYSILQTWPVKNMELQNGNYSEEKLPCFQLCDESFFS